MTLGQKMWAACYGPGTLAVQNAIQIAEDAIRAERARIVAQLRECAEVPDDERPWYHDAADLIERTANDYWGATRD